MAKKAKPPVTNEPSVKREPILVDLRAEELSAEDEQQLEQSRTRWNKMRDGSHLDDWLAIGESLLMLRAVAMQKAKAKTPAGALYNKIFSELQQEYFPGIDAPSVTALLWLHEDVERLRVLAEIRAKMTPGERARLNSPITAKQHVQRALSDDEDKPKPKRSARPRPSRTDYAAAKLPRDAADESFRTEKPSEVENADPPEVTDPDPMQFGQPALRPTTQRLEWPVPEDQVDEVADLMFDSAQKLAVMLARRIMERHAGGGLH